MVKMLDDEADLDLLQGVLLVLLVGLEALEDLHQLPLGELLKVTVLLRHLIHNVIYMVSQKRGTFRNENLKKYLFLGHPLLIDFTQIKFYHSLLIGSPQNNYQQVLGHLNKHHKNSKQINRATFSRAFRLRSGGWRSKVVGWCPSC